MENNDTVLKLSKFAMISSFVGLVTAGACPAFGLIGISVSAVLLMKLKDIDGDVKRRAKTAIIAGVISLLMFPATVALVYTLMNK